jgi:hypothetical protein
MFIGDTIKCQHRHTFGFNDSWLSYVDNLPIINHTVRGVLELLPGGETKRGTISVFAQFTAPGNLEGQIHVHLPSRHRRIGLCAQALKFTAKV